MQFAKLFNIYDDQVLLMKEYNSEEDAYTLKQITDLGFQIVLTAGYEEEKDCNEAFDNYLAADAQMFWERAKAMVAEMS